VFVIGKVLRIVILLLSRIGDLFMVDKLFFSRAEIFDEDNELFDGFGDKLIFKNDDSDVVFNNSFDFDSFYDKEFSNGD